jgi:tripartite ATP-independent transporter DctP family solute receptor
MMLWRLRRLKAAVLIREDFTMRSVTGTAFAVIAAIALAALSPAGAQDIQERTIRWGHLNNTDHPVSFGVQKFAEILAAKSGGKMKVREFPASQLGNEMQMQSAARGGTQEIVSASTASLASVVKDFGLLDLPFSVANFAQGEAMVGGPFGQLLLSKLPEKDLIGLGYWTLGFRNVTNSQRPIAKLEDFQGLKLRVLPSPVYVETFKAFKVNPVPMNFAELYSALETRTVDGQENPYSVTYSNKFYEVQKYVSSTNHTNSYNIIVVSKKFWDKLSPTEQRLMREAYEESREYQKQQTQLAVEKSLAGLREKGMTFTDITPTELGRMREATKPVIEKFLTEYNPETVKLFKAEADRIQKIQ